MSKAPSIADARPPTRSLSNYDTSKNLIQHADNAPKSPNSKQQQVGPVTPPAKQTRSRDSTQDSNARKRRLSRQNVVGGSSCCLRLTQEITFENRLYELEIMVHKKHKCKCRQCDAKAQKYEENRKEVFVPKCDGAEQSSETSVEVEVIGITRKEQAQEFDQTHQEAESKLKQSESSSPRQQSCYNTLTPYEIKSHIEQQVIAAVSSHVEQQVIAAVSSHVEQQVIATVSSHVEQQVIAAVSSHVEQQVIATVSSHVQQQVIAAVSSHIEQQVIATVSSHVEHQVIAAVSSHVEQQVIAAISSHVETLKNKMNKMEEKMKQTFDDLRKTDKAGVKKAIKKYFGKIKD